MEFEEPPPELVLVVDTKVGVEVVEGAAVVVLERLEDALELMEAEDTEVELVIEVAADVAEALVEVIAPVDVDVELAGAASNKVSSQNTGLVSAWVL